MSIWDIHYNALYASPIAVDAVLTVACGDPPRTLRAMDKTAGVVIDGSAESGRNRFSTEVQTVEPAAAVLATALADVDLADLRGATLEINGKTWTVRNHLLKPSPTGEAAGEVLLLLAELA